MEIKKDKNGATLTVSLIGRLDAVTSPELDKDLKSSLEGVKELIFDLAQLDYIASAGLRILLKYQKLMDKAGNYMKVKNVKAEVKEVLDMTGFSDFLHIIDNTAKKKLSIEF